MTVRGDKIRIEQIIINIVSNAIKYTPDGGDIRLRLADRGNTVEIAVSDNGVGIPEEDIPHLFERFYRVEKARSSRQRRHRSRTCHCCVNSRRRTAVRFR